MNIEELENKYGKEEVEKARKELKGQTWIGDYEELLEGTIKNRKKQTIINY